MPLTPSPRLAKTTSSFLRKFLSPSAISSWKKNLIHYFVLYIRDEYVTTTKDVAWSTRFFNKYYYSAHSAWGLGCSRQIAEQTTVYFLQKLQPQVLCHSKCFLTFHYFLLITFARSFHRVVSLFTGRLWPPSPLPIDLFFSFTLFWTSLFFSFCFLGMHPAVPLTSWVAFLVI